MRTSIWLAFLFLCPLPISSQTSAVPIGGPDSLSSAGYDDPGLLGDGKTEARARLAFTLDVPGATLTLDVQNFSPVEEGVPNPVLTRVYFNTPAAITGMTLLSQQAADGDVEPSFELTFDADRSAGVSPNSAGRFGAFNARLDNGDGIHGAIANAEADTIAPGDAATGPVTFVLALEGDLTGVTPEDFVSERSVNPPGDESVVAVGKFQGGGRCESSAFISGGDPFCGIVAEVEDLGGGCGPRLECGLAIQGETWHARVEQAPPGALGVLVVSVAARPVHFMGCDIVVDLSNAYRFLVFKTDPGGEAAFSMPIASFRDSPVCCGLVAIVQVGFRSKSVFQGATNACRVRLGS